MSRIESLLGQINLARGYTQSMFEGLEPEDWFRMAGDGVTHIAWQVGHLAVGEYYLGLIRIRGPREDDASLLTEELMTLFGKGSTPSADAAAYPSVAEIRAFFDRVHEQVVKELGELPDAVLDEPTEPPHPMFSTKLGALAFCPMHEMLHAGQIGLIRRLLGKVPLH